MMTEKKAEKAFNACKRAFEFFLKARIDEPKLGILRDMLDESKGGYYEKDF